MGEQSDDWLQIRETPPAARAWSLERLAGDRASLAIIGLGAAIAIGLGGFWLTTSAATPRIDLGSIESPGASVDPSGPRGVGGLLVDVAGAVRSPGLYHLPAGSRVGDAITAAGGFGPTVDAVAAGVQLNLAAPLTDGQKIVVPARGAAASTAAKASPAGGKVDLNHASESELDELPGIGPATAKKIIDARTERPFASPDEILSRKIVGQATWQKIRDLVTVT